MAKTVLIEEKNEESNFVISAPSLLDIFLAEQWKNVQTGGSWVGKISDPRLKKRDTFPNWSKNQKNNFLILVLSFLNFSLAEQSRTIQKSG